MIFQPIPISGTQIEAVPLPIRKLLVACKKPSKKAANAPVKKEWLSEKVRSAERERAAWPMT
jgi:hypothetical protein